MTDSTVVLITGDDDLLIAEAVRAAVTSALGDDDRSMALEELTEEQYRTDGDFDLATLVDAAQTPPMLTSRRVVVGRHVGRFGRVEDVAPLVDYLKAPLETTRLILVWEKGVNPPQQRLNAAPKSLTAAIAGAGGEVRRCSTGRGRDATQWLSQRFEEAEVDLDGRARSLVTERIGEERSRVVSLLSTLTAVFGPGTGLGAADVAPYMGEAGGVAPWELTDAIDDGDVTAALERLHRMLGAGDRHPMGVLAALHGHYARLLRLDGAGIRDENGAAEALGIKGYPARKAMAASRRLGSARIARSIRLIGDADLDLRGRSAWPADLVAEVLVARLASLARR